MAAFAISPGTLKGDFLCVLFSYLYCQEWTGSWQKVLRRVDTKFRYLRFREIL
jgi:hypothetical protein